MRRPRLFLSLFTLLTLFLALLVVFSLRAAPGDVILTIEDSLASPEGIAVDSNGNAYILDGFRTRIQVFDSNGTFIEFIGSNGTSDGQFLAPTGIAIDSSDNLYIVDQGRDDVQVFDSSGNFIRKFGSFGFGDGQFLTPSDVALGSDGNVYVVDTSRYDVQVFDSSGNFIRKFGSQGSGDGQFSRPVEITVNNEGLVYVVDRIRNDVQIFHNSGSFFGKFGSEGSGDGQFSFPSDIAVDTNGSVYIVDSNNRRIQVFGNSGNFIRKFGSSGQADGQFEIPSDIAIDASGNTYITDSVRQDVQVFDTSDNYVRKFGTSAYSDGEFSSPERVAVDSSGNVYVLDRSRDDVQMFDSSGSFVRTIGSSGTGNGQFSFPTGVAVDSSGNVYVTDEGRDDVQMFDSSGSFVRTIGSSGTGNGQFSYPTGIAIGSNDNVFVVDQDQDNVQVFNSSGNFLRRFGSSGTGNGQFLRPEAITVDSGGNVYVVDAERHDVQVFDSSGSFLLKFGSQGNSDGQFNFPYGIAVDGNSNVYVITSAPEVQVFNNSGSFLLKFGDFGSGVGQFWFPAGIAVDSNDNVYVVDSQLERVQVLEALNLPGASGNTENQMVSGAVGGGNILPTFSFTLTNDGSGNPVPPVEWINLLITDASGSEVLSHWFPYDRYCVGISCSFTLTPDLLPLGLLLEGAYSWQIQTWHPLTGLFGLSQPPTEFTINLDPPGVPQNVEVVADALGIQISWDYDPLAAWYHIVLRDADGSVLFDQWVNINDIDCDETRCTYTVPLDPETLALVNGNYTVEIQAWGVGGFNGGSDTQTSGQINWSIALDESSVPGIPAGGADWAFTDTATGSPTFRWTPAENATWHLLWVGRLDPLPVLTRYAYWVPVSEMDCPDGVTERCTYTPDNMFLTAETYDYEAWLLPWGPGDGSNPFGEIGKWTELGSFEVVVDPAGTAAPLTPTGLTDTGAPIFQWDHVPDVTWYNVWVGNVDENNVYTQFHFDWHRAREIGCLVTETCTIDPADLYLPENDYIWFILTYNPAGLGEWSSAGEFTVDRP